MKREVVITGLAEGWLIRDIAAAAGVSDRTITRYAHDPAIQDEVKQVRAQTRSRIAARVASAAAEAVETLAKLLSDSKATVRLGAARALLETYRAFDTESCTDQPSVPVDVITSLLARLGSAPQPLAGGHTVAPAAGAPESGLPQCSG